ncbi:Ig-like domain-containing protein [Plantibacter sp. Mn2098]|uniref:Ig-like domain-containing protein n=1 Tax=Plantibacter sp. Mn2098 TaxID=3395266 RepID=UPI003BC3239A
MKRISTLLVGIGMVGSALLATSAPALATTEPTGESGTDAITRLEGPVHISTWAGGFPDVYSTLNRPVKEGKLTATVGNGDAPDGSDLRLPHPGTQGVISGTGSAGGLCLAVIGGAPTWKTCSGDANRLWELVWIGDDGANGQGPGYAIRTAGDYNYYLAPSAASDVYGLTPHVHYASIIDLTLLEAVDTHQGEAVTVTSPAHQDTVDTNTPTFTGTGAPAAAIAIKDAAGTTLGVGQVGDDGTWAVELTVPLPAGEQTVTAHQADAAEGGPDVFFTSYDVTFTVAG